MPPIIVAGSQNSFNIGVCDFGPTPPTATPFDPPAVFGNCVIAVQGTIAVVGDFSGGRVQLVDITTPTAPVALGFVNTVLNGVGAVAISGTQVAAGESNGFRCQLIDISNTAAPALVGTPVNTPLGGFSSLAFRAANIVVGGGPNGPPTCVEVNFASATSSSIVINGLTGGAAVAVDIPTNRIVVGDTLGTNTNVFFLNGTTKAVLATANTTLNGVGSVAISGSLVLAGSANAFAVARINFGVTPPAILPLNIGSGSGSIVALSGTTGAAGAIVGGATTPISLLDLSTGIVVGPTVNPTVNSVRSLAFGLLPVAAVARIAAIAPIFALTRVGQSAQANLTVSNTGTAPLIVTAITSSSASFAVGGPTSFTIAPGDPSRTIRIDFAPNASQVFTGSLTVVSNDTATPRLAVSVTGTGAQPRLSVPASLSFGTVPINCSTSSLSLTLTNTGAIALTVSSVTVGAPYTVTPTSGSVAPNGGTISLTVTFSPTALGAANETLTINSDDPTNPSTSVAITGTGGVQPPPTITLAPTSFDFLDVPRQNHMGQWLTISNTSPCQALTVGLSTSGLPFLVAAAGSTTLPPSPVPLTDSVPPNQTRKYAVFFAPTALGPATGVLTVTSNDPARTSQSLPLTGNGVDVPPLALELVLDRSGSMSDPTPGGTKMDDLKRTAKMFADLVIPGQGHEMGTIEFDDQIQVLTARGSFDATKQTQIKTDIDTLTPRGSTAIGSALQTGLSEVNQSSLQRKAILVFTDGKENGQTTISQVIPSVVAAGVETYAIGLGGVADINADRLNALAVSSKGKFFSTSDTLVLNKQFVEVLTNAFRLPMLSDPIRRVSSGKSVDVQVWVTDCERRVTFALFWEQPAAQLELQLVAPDGTVFTSAAASANRLVRYGQRPQYAFYQIEFPRIGPPEGGYVGPLRAGLWTMRVTGATVPGGAERFATNVFAESSLSLDVKVQASTTARPLVITADAISGGQPVPGTTVSISVTAPKTSIADVVKKLKLKDHVYAALAGDAIGLTLLDRAVRAYATTGKQLISTRTTTFVPPVQRGRHTLRLPAPLVPGIYQYEITVQGSACGGTFQRYASGSIYIGNPLTPGTTPVIVTGGGVTTTVTVTPTGPTKVPLGPGLGPTIGGTVGGGRIRNIRDNLDGSYTVTLDFAKRPARPVLKLDIAGGTIRIPLGAKSDSSAEHTA